MKIDCIFADKLYAFRYKSEKHNELRRLLNLWNNISYLYQFIDENKEDAPKGLSKSQLTVQLIENANDIDDILNDISNNPSRKLEEFFMPLRNQEYSLKILSKQKGKRSYLRIYALKIDDNCFVITGGAIKFHHLNKDREHTQVEMMKLDKCRNYLTENNIFDIDSFYEFLSE